MRQYSNDEGQPDDIGSCFLEYGKFGYGKTHALGTLPDPIAIIITEPRDPRRILDYVRGRKKVTYFETDSFDEELSLLNKMVTGAQAGKLPYKSIGYDSLTFRQGLYKLTIEDDRYGVRHLEGKDRGILIDRSRLDESDWGPMASIMKRITYLLNRLSKYGITVVATASVMERPKWNRDFEYAPAFQGKEYPMLLNGYFDFIGYIIEPFQTDPKTGIITAPPVISFHSEKKNYDAKCCNAKLLQAAHVYLDYEHILAVMKGEVEPKRIDVSGLGGDTGKIEL